MLTIRAPVPVLEDGEGGNNLCGRAASHRPASRDKNIKESRARGDGMKARGFNLQAARLILADPPPPRAARAWRIIHGDCLDVLPTIDEPPRLISADPPYNIGINYGDGAGADRLPIDEYRQWLAHWIGLCANVLAADGSLWILMPHEHQADAFKAMEAVGLHWRNTITWYETFGVNCTRKFNRTSRLIHHFTKHPRRFVFNADAVRVPSDRQVKYGDKRACPAGKVPDDVWEIPRVAGTHAERLPGFPTQLPLELLQRIIAVASEPGDLVLDPFSGSATTGVAALEAGRQYVGIEKSAGYIEPSNARLRGCPKSFHFLVPDLTGTI